LLKKIVLKLKKEGKKIVFTNGCFDILHFGHAKYLQEARSKGDILVVGVNSDSSIRRIKGSSRPIVDEFNRISLLAALESVDFVVLFNEDTPLRVIKVLSPDILVKGADWNKNEIVGSDVVKNNGGRVLTINLIKGLSTTNLIKRIVEKN
jgi:D-beta-D-heptose 7-phosphate kinase/D-beta-D-heptose 1-phosphate adenosyltransferase